jgi:hypothetical protein
VGSHLTPEASPLPAGLCRFYPAGSSEDSLNTLDGFIPLDYPLPSRQWYRTANGWASREWEFLEREMAESALWKPDVVRKRPE